MRAVVQRVSRSAVMVKENLVGNIQEGLLVLLGVGKSDLVLDMEYLAEKIVNLRIFEDDAGKMNRSVLDIGGELLIVSQFTLYGDCRKGKRPSFSNAAPPEEANQLYRQFVEYIKGRYPIKVETGVFQETMHLEINNEGPVTMILDSKKVF